MQPTRIWLSVVIMTFVSIHILSSQHFTSARAMAMGAFTALASDADAIDWNPAGLTGIPDWELLGTSYYTPLGNGRTAALELVGLGKRFAEAHAASLRVSPGMTLDFVVPSEFSLKDSTSSFVTTFDKKISYTESYAFGYAIRALRDLSIGVSAHFLDEKVTDTEYAVDSTGTIHSGIVDYPGSFWVIDAGVLWEAGASWRLGVVAKNLLRITAQPIGETVSRYDLAAPKVLRAGIAYAGIPHTTIALDGDSQRMLRCGGEYAFGGNLFLRGGLYLNGSSGLSAEAIGLGIGGRYRLVRLDLGYVTFLDQTNRRGSADASAFQQASIDNIEYNPFAGDRISLTATVFLGRSRESLARIEYVDMLSDIFPASQPVYAFRPVGKARVRNTSSQPIDAKVSFFVDNLMDAPTVTRPYEIAPGDVAEIPFFAVFNSSLRTVRSLTVSDGEVFVNATPADDHDDHYQTRLLVRGRNDWNGDVELLKYFVTPDDPDMLAFTRATLHQAQTSLDSVPAELQTLQKVRVLYNEFTARITYVSDPMKSLDFVQYPGETLSLHGGDCDDMAVCLSSILASVGVASAFVDVVPPDHPDSAHIYLLFDTGIPAPEAGRVSDNPKRYVLRTSRTGRETVWVPVETTALAKRFDGAWETGAQEYFYDVQLSLGIVRGWVRIVDLEIPY
jgi:hypothetical protein